MFLRSKRNSVYGTVGTSPVAVFSPNGIDAFMKIHNPDPNNQLAYTTDGSTNPQINVVGTQLEPHGTEICDIHIPEGPIIMVASAPGTPFFIEWSTSGSGPNT